MSGIFGGGSGGGQNVSISSPIIASIRLQTSAFGRAIPLCYGTTRIAGNLLWYADFTPIPHTTVTSSGGGGGGKGGGGGGESTTTQTTYTYTAAAIMGLCEGEISALGRAWADKEVTTPSALGLSTYLGTSTQTALPYVSTNHPGEALGYRRLAYVGTGAYDLGDSATMPNHSFEVSALHIAGGGILDANPADVVDDLLTDTFHGAGYPSASLGDLSTFGAYCAAAGIFVSPAYIDQMPCSDLLSKLAKIGNSGIVYSESLLKVIPYGDSNLSANGETYTPNLTPVYALTDDDFLDVGGDPVTTSRRKSSDAFNMVQVRFFNRDNQYAEEIAEAKDQANIELYGLRPMEPVDLHEINDPAVALLVAHLLLLRVLYIRNTYRFTLGWKYILLEPMDLVTLTESSENGLQGVTVRITAVEEDEYGTLSVEAEDFPGNASSTVAYPSQQAGGYTANYGVTPGSVEPPLVFDAPGRCAPSGYELWCAVSGSDDNWGGAFVWASTDGSRYDLVGAARGRSRYGVLSSNFASGVDPDITNNCAVNLSVSFGELVGGTSNDADLLNMLAFVDDELISYQSATLTSAYNYTLGTRIRRGVYGTPISAHLSGGDFARIDSSLFRFPYDPSLIGTTIYLKFCSFNVWGGGAQNLADVTAYPYTIGGPIGRPSNVTEFSAAVEADGTLLTLGAVSDPNLAEYEFREGGSSWETATFIGRSRTTQLKVPPSVVGTTTWRAKAIDKSGKESLNDITTTLSVTAPSAPYVTAQVIDNNVLLYWTEPVSTQPVATYEIRRGSTYAGSTLIGTKTGLFTSVFETAAGAYTYWVTAIDNYGEIVGTNAFPGNYGGQGSVAATVNQPPDYVLRADFDSSLNGTTSNSVFSDGIVYAPVNTTETFAQHFNSRSWNTPQDQINANYPRFIEPTASTGYYEETFNYGTVLASSKVTVTPNIQTVFGTPDLSYQLSWKKLVGDAWTDLAANVTSAFLTDFQYVKFKITANSSGGDDLAQITGLNFRIDAKLTSDAGIVEANSSDANGTLVTFAQAFISVTSITTTPEGNAPMTAPYSFNGVANPTGFHVFLFNNAGTRSTGNVSWAVKGY